MKLATITALAFALVIPAVAETTEAATSFEATSYSVFIPAAGDWIQHVTAYDVRVEYTYQGKKFSERRVIPVEPQINDTHTIPRQDFLLPRGVEPKITIDRLVMAFRWTNSN